MNVRELAEARLAAEGKPADAKSHPRRVERSDAEPDLFELARTVDTISVLDRLGIEHSEKFATCPGCGEDGALIGKNGGIKCLHARCADVGPKDFPGFRSTIDMVMEAERLDKIEAAKRICEWNGIEVPEWNKKKNGASIEPPRDDSPDPTDADAPDAPPAESPELESHWIDLGNHLEWMTERPPAQTWLFKHWRDGRDHGVLPRGCTGLLNATGGVGKTYLAIQTGLAVASDGFLLETLRANSSGGHVLIALGEEDATETRRRISNAVNVAGFDDEQKRAIAQRLHVLPLRGVSVALTCQPTPGLIITSDFAVALRNKLNGFGVDWALVILDPLSRWASGGIEQNNELATRFVQILETFTTVRGNPSLLVAHHSSLDSVQAGKSRTRGVTGIRDAFRWEISMDGIESPDGSIEGVILRNTKSNYSLKFKPMALVRNTEPGIEGTFRLATAAEEEALKAVLPKGRRTDEERAKETQDRKRGAFEADSEAVLALVPHTPGYVSNTTIETALKAAGTPLSDKTIKGILERLASGGHVVDLSNGAQSKPRRWTRKESET
jgi:hypothetical protein